MRLYHLYFMDKLGVVVLGRPFRGPDDQAAIAQARGLSATHAIEVREDERVVARLPKREKPRPAPSPAGTPRRRVKQP